MQALLGKKLVFVGDGNNVARSLAWRRSVILDVSLNCVLAALIGL